MHIMTTIPSQLPFPQAQLLLHELNHRIGNEFCCADSVVSLAAARSNNKEVKAALTDVVHLGVPFQQRAARRRRHEDQGTITEARRRPPRGINSRQPSQLSRG